MKAVVNAGPLIALGKLGLVRLLSQLYDVVLIPPIVHEEVVSRGVELGESDAYVVQMAVLRNEIAVSDVIPAYLEKTPGPPRLHVGEQHAIALALQEQADWILLDDLLAREIAHEQGLRVKGTLGVLVQAHRSEILEDVEIEFAFQSILNRSDIWISDALVQRVWEEWRLTKR